MKISLFLKPYTIKVCSFFMVVSIMAMPLSTEAGWISDIFGGEPVQASSEIPVSDMVSPNSNSQNIDLDINIEPSVNPDLKNTKNKEDLIIVQDDSFISNEGSFIPDVKFEKSKLSDQIRVYTVEKGDTLSEIAETFGVSMNTIRWENNISGQTISIGQKLSILPVTGVKHIVKKGDTVSKIADKYEAESEDILIFNDIEKGDGLKQGDIVFVPNGIIKSVVVVKPVSSPSKVITSNTKVPTGYYLRPVQGRVTSPYGSRRGGFHPGVDLGGVRGTPVMAAADGVVSKVINGCVEGKRSCGGRYGNHIVIEHPNGTNTTYAHLSKTSVSVGQTVSQGEVIGLLGNTGQSTGPHLHFEVENANGSKMRPPF
jgi:murein DD-endopeptidase MepM/ murein hydrolase activator NlpD